jgi:hypothetical protein
MQEKASELGQPASAALSGDAAAREALKRLVAAQDALAVAKGQPEDPFRLVGHLPRSVP